jgi:hypothetical protein
MARDLLSTVVTTTHLPRYPTMSKDPQSPELPTIELNDLNTVTGGVTQAATDPNAQMETMLQSLMQSIQQLAQQNQSGGDMSQMMPMMMMMMGQHQSSAAPAPAAPQVAVGGVTPDGWTRVS